MKNQKYTPGPWIEDGNGFAKTWDVSNHEGSIATVATNRQDARLIAAAPELLEACECALNRLYHANQYGADMQSSRDLCIQDARDLLIQAISKARGES